MKELTLAATVENIETVTEFVNAQLELMDCPILNIKNCESKSETLMYYNPRFSTILRPFGVPTHVESVVCLTRKEQ